MVHGFSRGAIVDEGGREESVEALMTMEDLALPLTTTLEFFRCDFSGRSDTFFLVFYFLFSFIVKTCFMYCCRS